MISRRTEAVFSREVVRFFSRPVGCVALGSRGVGGQALGGVACAVDAGDAAEGVDGQAGVVGQAPLPRGVGIVQRLVACVLGERGAGFLGFRLVFCCARKTSWRNSGTGSKPDRYKHSQYAIRPGKQLCLVKSVCIFLAAICHWTGISDIGYCCLPCTRR